ncbi:glycerate kinase [Staphylococcus ureilyticus]|uniref:glycerate kinase n=1 Tax=Staphylococcus ureilyticus TaxID=94138 RepID=UPI000D1CA80F|nr:glycerate kinase [Staphylococcus ureilyticus]MDU0462618.1 glycerate kinase [Staphylococcus ureilyticus]PTF28726.1 glycerate kinase [Staphylococcus cohnii]
MEIILAPDSFKGSMKASEVTKYMKDSILEVFPESTIHDLPIGDGGEGTMEALINATNGSFTTVSVTGPLGDKVTAQYGILDNHTCVIEMAEASGLKHLDQDELNPLYTTTYGTGELILHALNHGYQNFILAIGGSATNDAGAGMLQALGADLKNNQNYSIHFGGGELQNLAQIDLSNFDPRIAYCNFIIATDVQNPLVGPNGASFIFGKQKGASAQNMHQLDDNLTHWANLVEHTTGIRLHDLPGAGAAGGLGGAFKAFFPSYFKEGIQVVMEYIQFEKYLKQADLILTGEGKIDQQSFYGKAPIGIAKCAKKYNVPVIFIGGSVEVDEKDLKDSGILSAFSLSNGPMSLEETFSKSEKLIKQTTKNIVKTFFHNQ